MTKMIGKDKVKELGFISSGKRDDLLATKVFCPNCGMIVETLTVDKRKHCGSCGIVLENPKP